MAMNTGGFSALLAPDLYRVFVDTGDELPTEYSLWCNVFDMPWATVKSQQISGLGSAQSKPQGERFPLDQPILGGTTERSATPYGLACEITWEMWRDELYGVMREIIRELRRASHNRIEVSAHAVLNDAFSTSYTGYTSGESLCSTSHTRLDGGTSANRPTTDIGVSAAYYQGAIERFENMVDERGLPRRMTPKLAVVAPTNKFIIREVLGSSAKPYSADNELNALIEDDLSWMVDHYFTDSGFHFLLADKTVHDLEFGFRDMPDFDNFDDPWTKNAVFTLYQRHYARSRFGSWRGVDGSQG